MKEKEILDVVYKQIALAYQEKLTDKAPEHFRQLKQFIEEERDKKDKEGGWL